MIDPELNATFRDIVGNLDLRKDGMYELASIDLFKDQLLARLDDHVTNLKKFDPSDIGAYNHACDYLTESLNRDFLYIAGLTLGDEVVSCHETPYCVMDYGKNDSYDCCLSQICRLCGTVDGVIVTPELDGNLQDEDRPRYSSAIPMHARFKLSIVLLKGRLEYSKGGSCYFDEGQTLNIPLGRQPAPIKKVVKQCQ